MSQSGSENSSLAASVVVRDLSLVVPYFAQPETVPSSWLAALLGAATSVPRRRFVTILDNISFSVFEGERVALVGRNGAGKSTLLRVLAGAFEPTSGSMHISGSRQALLSIGIGFNSEATVMENIFLRATAIGIPAAKMRALVDPVLDFTGLRDVANRRLLTLSSGQKMRLGFAISTAVHNDIMLLDEWFGAGDAQFVRQARQRLMDRIDGSKIVFVASHNESLLHKLCNRALLIDQGKVVYDGGVSEALAEYRRLYPVVESGAGGASKQKARRKVKARLSVDADAWAAARKKVWETSLPERARAWKEAKTQAWETSLPERARAWKEAKTQAWESSLPERARAWKEAKTQAWEASLPERARAWRAAKMRADSNPMSDGSAKSIKALAPEVLAPRPKRKKGSGAAVRGDTKSKPGSAGAGEAKEQAQASDPTVDGSGQAKALQGS